MQTETRSVWPTINSITSSVIDIVKFFRDRSVSFLSEEDCRIIKEDYNIKEVIDDGFNLQFRVLTNIRYSNGERIEVEVEMCDNSLSGKRMVLLNDVILNSPSSIVGKMRGCEFWPIRGSATELIKEYGCNAEYDSNVSFGPIEANPIEIRDGVVKFALCLQALEEEMSEQTLC